jgi:hypothetical protein
MQQAAMRKITAMPNRLPRPGVWFCFVVRAGPLFPRLPAILPGITAA